LLNVWKIFSWFFFLSFFIILGACSENNPTKEQSKEKVIQENIKESQTFEKPKDAGTHDIVEKIESKPEPSGPPPLANGVMIRITHVTDGDTLYAVTKVGAWSHKIRLSGFNAPECFKEKNGPFEKCIKDDEAFGLEAYKILKRIVDNLHGKRVKIICKNKGDSCEEDPFSRALASIQMPDGELLGKKLLLAGAAWSFTRYAFKYRADYCRAEATAIRKKVGMWKQGRAAAKTGMKNDTKNWYYNTKHTKTHDYLCTKAMGTSFSRLAGE
jgi:endonuclease YncB( thermonuclease family)